jgi:putative resolvase
MLCKITLSDWADRQNISKMTAWRWANGGKIPGAFTTPVGRWMVEIDEPDPDLECVAYARVSSHDQKADLDRQVARIAEWAAKSGVKIDRYVREVGSGLNDKRRALNELLSNPKVESIIVEHRDRLARLGVAQLEASLRAQQRRVIVIDAGELQDDLVRDMIDLMTCFSARLYGRRSAANRAKRALEALQA